MLLQPCIDGTAQQNNVHADVYPQDNEGEGRQAAVCDRHPIGMIHINGECKREDGPSGSGKGSARQLMQDVTGLTIWQKTINDPEKYHEHKHDDEGTEVQDNRGKLRHDRPVTLDEHLDVIAEDHQHKRQEKDQSKCQCVESRHQARDQIVSLCRNLIDRV